MSKQAHGQRKLEGEKQARSKCKHTPHLAMVALRFLQDVGLVAGRTVACGGMVQLQVHKVVTIILRFLLVVASLSSELTSSASGVCLRSNPNLRMLSTSSQGRHCAATTSSSPRAVRLVAAPLLWLPPGRHVGLGVPTDERFGSTQGSISSPLWTAPNKLDQLPRASTQLRHNAKENGTYNFVELFVLFQTICTVLFDQRFEEL